MEFFFNFFLFFILSVDILIHSSIQQVKFKMWIWTGNLSVTGPELWLLC